MKSFFEVFGKAILELDGSIRGGESLDYVTRKARNLISSLDVSSETSSAVVIEAFIIQKVYEAWWPIAEAIFLNEVVAGLGKGCHLDILSIDEHHSNFLAYLKWQRRPFSGHNVHKNLSEVGLLSESSPSYHIKERIIASYKEVLGLYDVALKSCQYEVDAQWFQRRIGRCKYHLSIVENKNDEARQVFAKNAVRGKEKGNKKRRPDQPIWSS